MIDLMNLNAAKEEDLGRLYRLELLVLVILIILA